MKEATKSTERYSSMVTKEELLHLWEDMKYVQRVAGDFSPTSYSMTSIKEIAMYWRNRAAKQIRYLESHSLPEEFLQSCKDHEIIPRLEARVKELEHELAQRRPGIDPQKLRQIAAELDNILDK